MNFSKIVLLTLIISVGTLPLSAQTDYFEFEDIVFKDYSSCAAVFYQGKMLVDEYSPKGKCKLEQGMTGKITVAAVNLGQACAKPMKNIPFQVAIRNKETNTMWMFSDMPVREIELKQVLMECGRGDSIIILTEDKLYSLPHHEIELMWGC